MIIQHDLSVMNSNRQFGLMTGFMTKSLEKLSSKYQLDTTADNAVGLSLNEKMTRRVNGFFQDSGNMQNWASYVQVADQALVKVDNMLARMSELCTSAVKETITDTDRAEINQEVQQIKAECNHIFHTTTFNARKIWDKNTTDKPIVGYKEKSIYTWSSGSYIAIDATDKNKAAWPKDNKFYYEADSSGVQIKWAGYDGVNYESKKIEWPSDIEKLKSGFTMALNSKTVDYSIYEAAEGINPSMTLVLDKEATFDQFIAELNGKYMTVSSGFNLSGTVYQEKNDKVSQANGISLHGANISYLAGLLSRKSIAGNENHINTKENNREETDDSTMAFSFGFDKNVNKNTDTGESINFDVNAIYNGTLYTQSSDRRTATENIWWHREGNNVYGNKVGFDNSDLKTALDNALVNGKAGIKNSLIKGSSVGGEVFIEFTLSTSEPVFYSNNDDAMNLYGNLGSFTLRINVSEGENADDVLNRISKISGINIENSSSDKMKLCNYDGKAFSTELWGETITINTWVDTNSEGNKTIPLIYNALNNELLGINDINTLTSPSALASIPKIKNAIKVVNEQRGIFGEFKNKMEQAADKIDTKPHVSSVNIAAEMIENSNKNILAKSGESLFAQANQTKQGVMSLLQ